LQQGFLRVEGARIGPEEVFVKFGSRLQAPILL